MSFLTHRVFLLWLLYLVLVVFGIGVLSLLGVPQLALHYDRSYLTLLLFVMYGTAEVLSGRQAWRISEDNRVVDRVVRWLALHKLGHIAVKKDENVQLLVADSRDLLDRCVIPPSAIADHLTLLCVKANAGQRSMHQDTMIDITAERLYSRALIGDFIAAQIVWVGILATIIGVILAFWPMIDGVSIDAMRMNLGRFFGGIATAFIPTAVSFVCKIILDINTRIIVSGVRELVEKIATVAETQVLPFLHTNGKITVL
jgi:hypothetical protein